MAVKRRKKHRDKLSGLVISMCYNEQNSKFWLFMNPLFEDGENLYFEKVIDGQ